MAEQQIEDRKSCLDLSARFPVVNWLSHPVAKSAISVGGYRVDMLLKQSISNYLVNINSQMR